MLLVLSRDTDVILISGIGPVDLIALGRFFFYKELTIRLMELTGHGKSQRVSSLEVPYACYASKFDSYLQYLQSQFLRGGCGGTAKYNTANLFTRSIML